MFIFKIINRTLITLQVIEYIESLSDVLFMFKNFVSMLDLMWKLCILIIFGIFSLLCDDNNQSKTEFCYLFFTSLTGINSCSLGSDAFTLLKVVKILLHCYG